MNRIILLGNGFDLAHNMKTSYNDFVKGYFIRVLSQTVEQGSYSDGLMDISIDKNRSPSIETNIGWFVERLYDAGIIHTLVDDVIGGNNRYIANPFKINMKSPFFYDLLQKCSHANWVDIENEYYEQLKEVFVNKEKKTDLQQLNGSLTEIIKQLAIYLNNQRAEMPHEDFSRIFDSKILARDTVGEPANDIKPQKTMVLNFNYTPTPENYIDALRTDYQLNYIHGKLDDPQNPLIFGFGDELDEQYLHMEQDADKGFLKYIKSFWYFKTDNYHKLLRFIEIDQYQILVLGHSCGLSDRTLLNMLFEHQNCRSIKIYYHQYEKDAEIFDNYEELTYQISRQFRDKLKMRRVLVSKERSAPMPKIDLHNG